jgi:lipopolysaccharide export system permease protein
MKQKSPEVEIPEGMFYDGIPGSNLYVQKKNMETGKLYGIMIYRMTGSYEDQAIILADSGMLQSTAEKKHLLLTLWSGEWFENMRSQDIAGSASVPYRRETFALKKILLDFDGEFNLADAAGIASDARAKGLEKIYHDLDSINEFNDSVGRQFYREAKHGVLYLPSLEKKDSLRSYRTALKDNVNYDSIFAKKDSYEKQRIFKSAMEQAQIEISNLAFKSEYANSLHRRARNHQIEAINKIALALSCIIFFFIGAPLGAIIRKGGLGVPVIISVLVFIVYYIFDNSGMRMARDDNWTVWFGKWLATMVLTPLAVFFTYKANNDSVVFNIDSYKNALKKILGLRTKRHVFRKEVIIDDPNYAADIIQLENISQQIRQYSEEHSLLHWPNPFKVFFRAGDDQRIEAISQDQESVIEDLGNTRDKILLNELNNYPILATHAHTRPFRQKWLNAITGIVLPLGVFFYFRMLRFRLRLYKDLRVIVRTNNAVVKRIEQLQKT